MASVGVLAASYILFPCQRQYSMAAICRGFRSASVVHPGVVCLCLGVTLRVREARGPITTGNTHTHTHTHIFIIYTYIDLQKYRYI